MKLRCWQGFIFFIRFQRENSSLLLSVSGSSNVSWLPWLVKVIITLSGSLFDSMKTRALLTSTKELPLPELADF